MKIGFIGLGNVGGKLAGSILRNGFDLTVRDLDRAAAEPFLAKGAHWADSPAEMARACAAASSASSPSSEVSTRRRDAGTRSSASPISLWSFTVAS